MDVEEELRLEEREQWATMQNIGIETKRGTRRKEVDPDLELYA